MVFINPNLFKDSISTHFILTRLLELVLVSECDFIANSAQLDLGLCWAWQKTSARFGKKLNFLRNFDAQIVKICKMHWKLRIKQTPVLFCKYLCNERLNLYENLWGGQYLSCKLKFKFHEDPFVNACARVERCAFAI